MDRDVRRWPGSRRGGLRIGSTLGALAIGLGLFLGSAQTVEAGGRPSFEERARADFRRLPESKALLWDTNAIRNLALVDAEDILGILLGAFRRPPTEPARHLRYILATAIRDRYDPGRHAYAIGIATRRPIRGGLPLTAKDEKDLLRFLKKIGRDDEHAWAVYQIASALSVTGKGTEELEKIVARRGSAVRRAAVIEALGRTGNRRLLDLAPPIWKERIGKAADRSLVFEALAWSVARLCRPVLVPRPAPRKTRPPPRGRRRTAPKPKPSKAALEAAAKAARARVEAARAALRPIVGLLRKTKKPARLRRELRRALQHALGADEAYHDVDTWAALLADGAGARPAPPAEGATVVRFMGLAVEGDRIVFALDASDSMLNPLTPAEKEALARLLGDDVDAPSGGRSGSTGARRGPFAVDLAGARTRFDAAREHLKYTLGHLKRNLAFAIVLFGDKAELLPATPGLVRATPANAARAIEALHAIKPGRPNAMRKEGTLRGQTNIRGALALALRVGPGRALPAERVAYVDRGLLLQGADSIYLLSDGKPTRDGFGGQSPAVEIGGYWREAYEGETTDPETGQKRKVKWERMWIPKRTQQLHYASGPYIQTDRFVDELRRMNLFRKATIHVVGIGEADRILPRRIAEEGRGEWIRVGPEKSATPRPPGKK